MRTVCGAHAAGRTSLAQDSPRDHSALHIFNRRGVPSCRVLALCRDFSRVAGNCILTPAPAPGTQDRLFESYKLESQHENNEILISINCDYFARALK